LMRKNTLDNNMGMGLFKITSCILESANLVPKNLIGVNNGRANNVR